MVPGEFKTVMPNLAASPDLGRTWPSKPSGILMAWMVVSTPAKDEPPSVMFSLLSRSRPAEPSVA